MNFLRFYIHFENPEMNIKFDREIEVITQNKKTMGIEEFLLDRAEKKGIEKSKMDFIKSLLTGTEFSNTKIASLVGVSVEMVEKIKTELERN